MPSSMRPECPVLAKNLRCPSHCAKRIRIVHAKRRRGRCRRRTQHQFAIMLPHATSARSAQAQSGTVVRAAAPPKASAAPLKTAACVWGPMAAEAVLVLQDAALP